MRVTNTALEYQALRTICAGQTRGDKLMAMLTSDSFGGSAPRSAFQRIAKGLQRDGKIPSWSELCADPTLSEKDRTLLKNSGAKPAPEQRIESLGRALDKLRQVRALAKIAERIYDAMESDSIDIEEHTNKINEDLVKIRTRVDLKTTLFHSGTGNNTTKMQERILGGTQRRTHPTGFEPFDEMNDGLLPGSLVVIAGESGAGKSALANQLALNMSQLGSSVAMVPLEMTAEQMEVRKMGSLSGISVNKIGRGKLSDKEKEVIRKAIKRYNKTLKEQGTRYTTWAPDEDVSIEEVLFTLKPYKYDVIIVDYISLLKGADGEEQWKELARISRFAKVWAKNTNSIVVLLAQLSEEGRVRYAGAIKENANNLWQWFAPKERSAISILEIEQTKARNQRAEPFQLMSVNDCMRITKVDDSLIQELNDDVQAEDKRERKTSKAPAAKNSRSKKFGDRNQSQRPQRGHQNRYGRGKDQKNSGSSKSDSSFKIDRSGKTDSYLADVTEV